jgi:Na+-transporting NADH:ubiquinone oxidoreductase subunit F
LIRAVLLVVSLCAAMIASAQQAPATAKVVSVESLTHNVKRLRVRMPNDYRFEAGQFALIAIPPAFVEAWNAKYKTKHGAVRRPYSFASSPKRLPVAEFIIQLASPPPGRDVPPGVASTFIHSGLHPGDTIEISAAMGSLSKAGDSAARPLILVAGGTGVAPYVGLLDHWFRTKQQKGRKIFLFFGARQRRDLMLDGQFRRWAAKHSNFTYVPALSDPAPDDKWTESTGFINVVLDKHFTGTIDADVLIAGSPRMMQETVKVVKAKGVPEAQIRHDPITVAP